jgi:hypothetical protein
LVVPVQQQGMYTELSSLRVTNARRQRRTSHCTLKQPQLSSDIQPLETSPRKGYDPDHNAVVELSTIESALVEPVHRHRRHGALCNTFWFPFFPERRPPRSSKSRALAKGIVRRPRTRMSRGQSAVDASLSSGKGPSRDREGRTVPGLVNCINHCIETILCPIRHEKCVQLNRFCGNKSIFNRLRLFKCRLYQ